MSPRSRSILVAITSSKANPLISERISPRDAWRDPARQVKPRRTRSPAKVADSDYDESLVTGANYGADARRGVGRGRGVGCGLGDGVGLGVGVAVGVGVRVGVGVGVAVPNSEYFTVV